MRKHRHRFKVMRGITRPDEMSGRWSTEAVSSAALHYGCISLSRAVATHLFSARYNELHLVLEGAVEIRRAPIYQVTGRLRDSGGTYTRAAGTVQVSEDEG